MKTKLLLLIKYFFVAFVLSLISFFKIYSQNDYCNNCLPPLGGQYTGTFHQNFNGLVDLSNPVHSMFTSCDNPPQNIGDSTTHSFGSTVTAAVKVTNGPTFIMNAPAQVTVKIKMVGQSGNLKTYETEMLQLDIQGGNLPPGTMIRESPTIHSTGMTTIQMVSGGYVINSFFDISTELSLDAGQTWIPSNQPGHMVLTPPTMPCPTLSQWGLLVLSLVLVAAAVWYIKRRRMA